MSEHDPFAAAESDRTIIMPTPGRRAATPAPSAATINPMPAYGDAAPADAGLNPLVAAANPLLNMTPQLRATLQHPDPAGLRDYLAQGIKTFEERARAAGVVAEHILAARYVLCALLDEAAASTPWGGSGTWARHSLLVTFHGEAYGGEKFFQLLSKLAENVRANRDLLELMYVCLALGFEGRYRVVDNGIAHLDALRERLHQLLRKERGEYERELSPHWQGATTKAARTLTAVPLWVAAAAAGLVMLMAYLSFSYLLNSASDPVFAKIQSLSVQTRRVPAASAAAPRLAILLAPEIAQDRVAVRDEQGRSIVTVRGDNLFESGSATIEPAYLPVLARVADALNDVPGQVQITGHTDDRPIRSVRFPSNWHLSEARARSVMQLLAQRVVPSRMSAEGRADAEPVAENSSAAGRARNRRVEITLFVAHATGK